MRRVLVPVDFSEPSDRALLRAGELHRRLGVAITVLHVVLDPFAALPSWAESALWMTPARLEHERERALQRLRAHVEQVLGPQASGARIEVVVAPAPSTAIVEAVAREDADLVCLGATGWGAVERVLLGSVAERVLRRSPVPVLVEP